MKTKLLTATALCAAALFGAATASAQEAGYVTPKTSWGAPDLQGFWNNTSITSLQRSPDAKALVVTEKEANRLVNRNVLIVLGKEDNATNGQDPNNTKLLEDKNNDRGYNSFWIDPGTKLASVKGELRTSWIVEPANGRVPYRADAARGGGYAITNFDGPETRPMAERCVLGFSGSYGPVMMNGMYNNTMTFVQTPGFVAITVEMNHDARIIPTFASQAEAKHGNVPKWGGDSVGWYEGNTLVVETNNVHPNQRAMITSDRQGHRALHALERSADPVRVHGRRSGALQPDVEGRDGAERVEADVRIRLPRRQPRHAGHSRRRARTRSPRPGAGHGPGYRSGPGAAA